MILNSPAYQSGRLLEVLTFDESGFSALRACPGANPADCGSSTGTNVSIPGFSPILCHFHLQTPPTATSHSPVVGRSAHCSAADVGSKPAA